MKYNYNKLKQTRILNVIEKYYRTRQLDLIQGQATDLILIGDKPIVFTVEEGKLCYYSGVREFNAYEIQRLSRVMDVLQSTITLECVEFSER